jgi:hypothetical protein
MSMRANHPQRLTPPSPPGALLKQTLDDIQRRRKVVETITDTLYLEQVRELPCLKCGIEPPPNNEAAHVRMQSGAHGKRSGMGKKPGDKYALPLCASCHRLDHDSQHKLGEREFWNRVGINPLLVCERLYEQRGDVVAMRAVVIGAIGERRATLTGGE